MHPLFPAPAAPVLPIGSLQDFNDQDFLLKPQTPQTNPSDEVANSATKTGPGNEETLEILSVHERLVDVAVARSPPTARAPDIDSEDESQAT